MFSISTQYIIKEAKSRNYKIEIIDEDINLFYIDNGSKKVLFKNIDGGVNSSLGFKLSNNKNVTYIILEHHKLPYPKSIKISNEKEYNLEEIIKNISFPLVVKPTDTNHGVGITGGITTKEELEKAIEFAFEFGKEIIIQKFIEGHDHRILVVGGKVVAGIQRRPSFIIGDGKSSIRELIEEENKNPNRGERITFGSTQIFEKALIKINIDDIVKNHIKKYYNYTPDSIPQKNEEVILRGNSNISTGGIYYDITDDICSEIKDLCIKTSQVFGLHIAGIDIMTKDISMPIEETNGGIIEINATPGIDMHDSGIIGKPRNVCKNILDLYF